MAATQLYLNDQLVTITAESSVIKKLNEDDHYLADYVNKAAKMGRFNFFLKDCPVKKIIVRRASASSAGGTAVWYKKGRPSEADFAATALLLKLRASEKYFGRFKDGYSLRNKLWDEIAVDMRAGGYDVDGHKCSQKFLNLAQNYYKYRQYVESCDCQEQKIFPPDFYAELHRILGNKDGGNNSDDDEEWLPKNKKRKRNVDEDDDFFKKFLKKNCEQKEERFHDMCDLIKKRNELIKDKLKQNEKIISLLEKFIAKN